MAASEASYGHGTDNAWDDAVQLVLHVMALPQDAPESVLDDSISPEQWGRLQELLRRRTEEFVPVPYLTGRAWFAGLEFLCDERALVPRSPIAELIQNEFLPWYNGPEPTRVLDLCCGGGCIGLATAQYFPGANIDLADIDTQALELARDNARFSGVQQRVSLYQSDLFGALADQCYNIILSNPPYVDAADLAAMPREYHHEPAIGLGSGEDGLDLTRFASPGRAQQTRDGLARGTVDIVIGTHALLAKNIRFQNLGLLIIDEEQHFGVSHKERLKQLRSDIHVLTLTATPIPRTLQLSLTGVRDLSIIGTPPVDRLAIRTYVSEFDAITIREALLREHYRGGQSFYVVPRINDLAEIEEFLKDQLPELTYVVAHGQMAAGELDDRMNAFYDGKYDVLLATTIVESGLDIPTANTMVVHRADMFGLAQLYQIRGRVGRSKTRAYAYLTTKPRARLTATAEKRLRVLGSLDTLGAGFTLASQDLDIRGAGNLLGEEQSGQMRDVGYELYQSMLEEAIAKIRAGEMEGLSDADDQWAPQINLGVPVLIPEDYVPDLDVRLGLYRRLSSLSTKVELEGFAAELIDRFGKLPREVNTLLLVVRIKAMCKRAGIAKLDGGPKGATIQFHNDKFASPQGLVEFIQAQNGLAKVRDNKIVVRRDWRADKDKIKGAFAIARDLAEKVVAEKKKAKAK